MRYIEWMRATIFSFLMMLSSVGQAAASVDGTWKVTRLIEYCEVDRTGVGTGCVQDTEMVDEISRVKGLVATVSIKNGTATPFLSVVPKLSSLSFPVTVSSLNLVMTVNSDTTFLAPSWMASKQNRVQVVCYVNRQTAALCKAVVWQDQQQFRVTFDMLRQR